MLVHPQALSEKTLYAIDQFVLRGGKALVFVDPHSEAQAIRAAAAGHAGRHLLQPRQAAPGLGRRLRARTASSATRRRPGRWSIPSNGREQVVDYLPWLSLDRSHLAEGEVVTAELNRINLGTAGVAGGAGGGRHHLHAPDPLERATPWRSRPTRSASTPTRSPCIRDFKPGGKELVLAARVSGPAQVGVRRQPPGGRRGASPRTSTEAGQPGPDRRGRRHRPARRPELARAWSGQQVAVPFADNANLVANALDYLVGSEALMSLRGREVTLRPFTKVAEIRRDAETQYRAKEQELLQRLSDLQGKLSSLQVADGEDASAPERGPAQGDRRLPQPAARDAPRAARRAAGAAAGHRAAARPDPLPQHRGRAAAGGAGGDRDRPGPARALPAPLRPGARPERGGLRPCRPRASRS